ncbi:universal stress protein [Microbispora rosea]
MTEPISDPFADRVSDPVVVGTDGSAGATRAVEWAAGHAVLQGLPLRVVHAVERLPYDGPRYPIPDSYDRLAPSGRQLLDHAERVARDRRPGLDVTTELAEGRPGRVLRDQAARASEVVLGSHGAGGFPGMLLGSVGNQVAGHVAVPVVVVRPEPPEAAAEIVAGFDCSEASGPALAYAFEEARLRGHRVRVVCAWEPPVPYGPVIGMDLDGMRRAEQRGGGVRRRGGHGGGPPRLAGRLPRQGLAAERRPRSLPRRRVGVPAGLRRRQPHSPAGPGPSDRARRSRRAGPLHRQSGRGRVRLPGLISPAPLARPRSARRRGRARGRPHPRRT